MKTLRVMLAACAAAVWSGAYALTLAPDAPERYVVRAGDTLWSLAGRYLADPWSWGELWRSGAGIDNPNRIYPGDVLTLGRDADGRPVLQREAAEDLPAGDTVHLAPKVRSADLPWGVPTIPHDIAAAFMSRPTLVPAEELGSLPYVLGFDRGKLAGAVGDRIYAKGLSGQPGERFELAHVGERVRDPESGQNLGYQAIYTASARLDAPAKDRHGAASLTVTASARETLPGDRVLEATEEARLDFLPRTPQRRVDARIAAVIDGVSVIGQYHVVLLNRGRRAGLEPGHVLRLWHEPGSLVDHGPGGPAQDTRLASMLRRNIPVPAEPAGHLLVFRTYPNASYALILAANAELRVGDHARSP